MTRRWRVRAATDQATEKRRNDLAFSEAVVRPNPSWCTKKKDRFRTVFFLSNPKDWYGITARSAVHGIRRFATAWHHAPACIYLRIDAIHHFVMIPYKASP